MPDDHGISDMRKDYYEQWLGISLLAITEDADGQFTVHKHSPRGVAPPTTYPTMKKAVARLMQLAGTGVVAPQTWPESVCIGHVDLAQEENP